MSHFRKKMAAILLSSELNKRRGCLLYKNDKEVDSGSVGVSIPGGPLGRRVSVAACPSPDGSSARASAKGGEARRSETGVREVGIPRPSCSSRAQVGCACSCNTPGVTITKT
jgi:hypothetical protein